MERLNKGVNKDILLIFENKIPFSELTDTEKQAYIIGVGHGEEKFLSKWENVLILFVCSCIVFIFALMCAKTWPEIFLK